MMGEKRPNVEYEFTYDDTWNAHGAYEKDKSKVKKSEDVTRLKMKIKGEEKMEEKKDGTFEGVNTNLISKNYSPMIIRKFNAINGWPTYLGIITDYDLSDLDNVFNEAVELCKEKGLIDNNIQHLRNANGVISEYIINYYNSKKPNVLEGLGILMACDKLTISGLYGDFMNHTMCRSEFYSILNMMPHI